LLVRLAEKLVSKAAANLPFSRTLDEMEVNVYSTLDEMEELSVHSKLKILLKHLQWEPHYQLRYLDVEQRENQDTLEVALRGTVWTCSNSTHSASSVAPGMTGTWITSS